MSLFTLSTFTASDGDNLALHDWPLEEGRLLRGVVVLVHGLGEHAGRYQAMAQYLNLLGFAVRGYDQYGHGESGGVRGTLPSNDRLVDDLYDVLESTRVRVPLGVPLLLMGHSVGALVASLLVVRHPRLVDGLVLSSPTFLPRVSFAQRCLLSTIPILAPNWAVSSRLVTRHLSRNQDAVAAWEADPHCHDRMSGRMARFVLHGAPQALAAAPRWRTPTLLMFGGSDLIMDPAGCRSFAARVPARSIRVHEYPSMFHEVFSDPDRDTPYADLTSWLDAHYSAAQVARVAS